MLLILSLSTADNHRLSGCSGFSINSNPATAKPFDGISGLPCIENGVNNGFGSRFPIPVVGLTLVMFGFSELGQKRFMDEALGSHISSKSASSLSLSKGTSHFLARQRIICRECFAKPWQSRIDFRSVMLSCKRETPEDLGDTEREVAAR